MFIFNTALKSNEIILERLQRTRWLLNDPDAEDMIEDVIIENKQAIEMTNIYSNILSGIDGCFCFYHFQQFEHVVMKFYFYNDYSFQFRPLLPVFME